MNRLVGASLDRERPHAVAPVVPPAEGGGLDQVEELLVAPGREQAGEAGRASFEVAPVRRAPAQAQPRQEVVGGPGCALGGAAQLAPAVADLGEEVHAVFLDGRPEPVELALQARPLRRRGQHDLDQLMRCPVGRIAQGPGGAVDRLERGPQTFHEQDRTLGRGLGVVAGDRLDLAQGILESLNRELRPAPAEGTGAQALAEAPGVDRGLHRRRVPDSRRWMGTPETTG